MCLKRRVDFRGPVLFDSHFNSLLGAIQIILDFVFLREKGLPITNMLLLLPYTDINL